MKKSKSYILCVGRLSEQKAYDVLLKAFKEISPKMDNWYLVILGKGELKKELHEMAEDLNISERVEWKGHVTNPQKYYENADIYVLPSRHEGMSNSLLEAMSFGLPAIVSEACHGSLDVIKHNKTGFVIPVNDHMALASAIEHLANNYSLTAKELEAYVASTAAQRPRQEEQESVANTGEKTGGDPAADGRAPVARDQDLDVIGVVDNPVPVASWDHLEEIGCFSHDQTHTHLARDRLARPAGAPRPA